MTTPKDHEKKPREQRVMEHAEETENGAMPPPQRDNPPRTPVAPPERTRGGEPPEPIQPPTEPGVHPRQHR
jgi:hypothetical protein